MLLRVDCRVAVLGLAVFLSANACTQRVGVGQNKTVCSSDSHCPETAPRCESEVGVCAQCLDASDCGGSDPRCDAGMCVCETASDCSEVFTCQDERCTPE